MKENSADVLQPVLDYRDDDVVCIVSVR